jgi:hypothetical protein
VALVALVNILFKMKAHTLNFFLELSRFCDTSAVIVHFALATFFCLAFSLFRCGSTCSVQSTNHHHHHHSIHHQSPIIIIIIIIIIMTGVEIKKNYHLGGGGNYHIDTFFVV